MVFFDKKNFICKYLDIVSRIVVVRVIFFEIMVSFSIDMFVFVLNNWMDILIGLLVVFISFVLWFLMFIGCWYGWVRNFNIVFIFVNDF